MRALRIAVLSLSVLSSCRRDATPPAPAPSAPAPPAPASPTIAAALGEPETAFRTRVAPTPEHPVVIEVGRTADGGFSFEVARLGQTIDSCMHDYFQLYRKQGDAWVEVPTWWPDPRFKGALRFIDQGPPEQPPKGKAMGGRCESSGLRPLLSTHQEWSGNRFADGTRAAIVRAAPGHYRVNFYRAEQEFDIP